MDKNIKSGTKSKKKRPDNKTGQIRSGRSRRPMNPYIVLVVAIVLPGVGQVINNTPLRGLIMVFFMIVGAWICFHTTTPEHSFLGRYAGGWFIYAMSILDAYRWARHRSEYDKVHGLKNPDDLQ